MAYTERFVATDATVGPFVIGFNYQDASTMKVVLMELDETNPLEITFSFAGTPSEEQPAGTTVLLNFAYPVGKQIRIFKDVDLDSPRVDWNLSATLTEENLDAMTINLMEMAQVAYDAASSARLIALTTSQELGDISADLQAQLDAAQAAAVTAEYWAQVALEAGSTANPEEAAAIARDAAIAAKVAAEAARDAAIAARDAAQAARDLSLTYSNNSSTSATNAANSATAANASKNEAAAIVLAGSLRWSGSLKFVSTTDPDPLQGANGDFWFKREV